MPADFTIRVATPDDGSAVGALLKASYPPLMRSSYDAAVLAAALPMMIRAHPLLLASSTYYLVEFEGGRIVGCGGWTRERPGSGEVEAVLSHIRHFATHPDWIGRGIGRALYARCEEEARSAGVRRFECFASLNAEGFYGALGFESVRPLDVSMGSRVTFPAILMARAI